MEQNNSTQQLRACPFCGNSSPNTIVAMKEHQGICRNLWMVKCIECGAVKGYAEQKEGAIESWNMRHGSPSIQQLHEDAMQWRKETFGDRHYTAPLYHLKKEIDEILTADKSGIPFDPSPGILMEFADATLLLLDAFGTRHPDLKTEDLLKACFNKLEINKKRKWGKADEHGAFQHIEFLTLDQEKTIEKEAEKLYPPDESQPEPPDEIGVTPMLAEYIKRACRRSHVAGARKYFLETERLKDVLHIEKSGLAAALEKIHKTAEAWRWASEARGPYEAGDDSFYKEMGYMVETVSDLAIKALRESGRIAHAECCGKGERQTLYTQDQLNAAVIKAWENAHIATYQATDYSEEHGITIGDEYYRDKTRYLAIPLISFRKEKQMIKKFKKGLEEVEAINWIIDVNTKVIESFVGQKLDFSWTGTEYQLDVPTRSGIQHASSGDWIVKDEKGNFFVMLPGQFEGAYQPIS